jgi:hypothetical protein
VYDYIITFFGCKTIKVPQVDNKSLVAFIVIHTLKAHQQKGTWLQLPYHALLCLIELIRHNKAVVTRFLFADGPLSHLMGSGALTDMNHLWLSNVTLYLHVGKCIVEAPGL